MSQKRIQTSRAKPKADQPVSGPVHIKDLVPDPANRRQHNPRNIGMVVDALHAVGAARSIVIDEDNVVLAGNGVLEAAGEAGITRLRVIEADGQEIIAVRRSGLSEAQKRHLAIADNRSAELAQWNAAQFKDDLGNGLDFAKFFSPEELAAILGTEAPKEGLTDPDAVPEERATDIQVGDLFELGTHRLLCGDCTDPVAVEMLMAGAKAGLMNTDPPYGVAYANDDRPNPGVAKPRVANDALTSPEDLGAFLSASFFTSKRIALAENAAWYVWFGNMNQNGTFIAAAAAADVVLHRQIVWVKPVLLLGRGQYHWKHEPCFMGWVDGHQPPDYGLGNGERTQTTVWEVDGVKNAERKEFNHSTPKPVGLFTIPIAKHLKSGEACYEPFAGSGPQFIAAEQHHVRCFGLELEPKFCQVIIDRWEKFTGQKAVKVGEAVRV
jgi:DNA modification methylase